MRRKSFSQMQCPIARSLEHVGEWWTILILRDAFHGLTRFDQFQKSLAIAPNMLARRLAALVQAGLMERRGYQANPPRDEYLLTPRGRDFLPVMVALMDFGNRHFADEGVASLLVDARTGQPAEPVVTDGRTGRKIDDAGYRFAAGPAADENVRKRMAYAQRKREERIG
jgi:DNA-binding HxlR family transcriptional regulator